MFSIFTRPARPVLGLVAVNWIILLGAIFGTTSWNGAKPDEVVYPLLCAVCYALSQAQGVLAASWLVLGRGRFGVRLGQVALHTLLLAASAAILIWFCDLAMPNEGWGILALVMFSLFAVPVLIASAILCAARPFGWRWRTAEEPSRGPLQFSIAQSIGATVVVAVLLTFARRAYAEREAFQTWIDRVDNDSPYMYLMIAVLMVLTVLAPLASGLVALVACVGPRPRVGFVIASLVIAYGFGLAASVMFRDNGFAIMLGAPAAAAATALAMGILQWSGYRLDCLPLPVAESVDVESVASPGAPVDVERVAADREANAPAVS
ncbi:MAG TPA: hypothetical protein VGE52_16595 [Pirellulales bacterium]